MKALQYILLGIMAIVFAAAGCTEEKSGGSPTSITFSPQTVEVEQWASVQLQYSVTPDGADVLDAEWSSAAPEIASVDDMGTVTGLSMGETVVTLSVGEVSANCKIVVTAPSSYIKLSSETLVLRVDESETVTAEVFLEQEEPLVWESADENVVSVSQDGEVTGVSLGETVVTASCGKMKAECRVCVLDSPALGDYYYEDGTYSSELNPEKEPVGMVYYVDDDGRGGYVVSLDEECLPWSSGKRTNAVSYTDGMYNFEQVKDEYPDWETEFPAFAWCASHTGAGLSWFLPALLELKQFMAGASGLHWVDGSGTIEAGDIADSMWGEYPMPYAQQTEQDRLEFSDRLVAAGGDPLCAEHYNYWSSQDRPDYGFCVAWGLTLTSGSTDFNDHNQERSVRAIARF